jgi:hypothetical protein
MYSVVRMYEMSEDWDDTLRSHLTEDFIPVLEKLPGFVSYQAIEADKRLFCSVTVFEDRAGAAASNRLAAEYVGRNLADRFPSLPEITSGEVRASSGVPARS